MTFYVILCYYVIILFYVILRFSPILENDIYVDLGLLKKTKIKLCKSIARLATIMQRP